MEKKHYARYVYVRGNQTLWRGDYAVKGSQYREITMTSNEWNSTIGVFQVCALAGTGNGIADGKFSIVPDATTVLFDEDFQNYDAAAKKFGELVTEAEKLGFQPVSFMDILEFHQKIEESRAHG